MKLYDIIEREVSALKRDREWEKGWEGVTGRSAEECIAHMNEYPSLVTRFNRFVGIISRAKDKVLSAPYEAKAFIHRGRHGWATPDTWSMDYALAKQLDGLFREFVRASSGIIDYTEDDTDHIALEIANGFRAYWQHQDKVWHTSFEEEDLRASWEAEKADFAVAHEKLKRSCELMAENWPRFWW